MATDYEKIEVLTNLSEACWKEYDTRRSYEWKVSFGLWTSIGLIAGFSLKEDIILNINVWWIISILFVLATAYTWWQYGLRISNARDQDKRHEYYKVIHESIGFTKKDIANLNEEIFKNRPRTSHSFIFFNWSHSSQLLITYSFLLLLGLILTRHDLSKSQSPNPDSCGKCRIEFHNK
jgi:hypothetical protein